MSREPLNYGIPELDAAGIRLSPGIHIVCGSADVTRGFVPRVIKAHASWPILFYSERHLEMRERHYYCTYVDSVLIKPHADIYDPAVTITEVGNVGNRSVAIINVRDTYTPDVINTPRIAIFEDLGENYCRPLNDWGQSHGVPVLLAWNMSGFYTRPSEEIHEMAKTIIYVGPEPDLLTVFKAPNSSEDYAIYRMGREPVPDNFYWQQVLEDA